MITKNLLQIRENTEYRGNKEEFYKRGNTFKLSIKINQGNVMSNKVRKPFPLYQIGQIKNE